MQTTSLFEAYPILTRGPKAEMNHAALLAALSAPATIAANDSWTSPVISADGFYDFAVGVTLTNAGTLILQRYVDDAGSIALDSGKNQALTANTSAALVVTDGEPCASFQVKITNSGDTTATVSSFAALASAH